MALALDLVAQQWQRKIIVGIAVFVGMVLFMASAPASPEASWWHEAIEWGGVALVLVGVIGRTWCSMYISGSKLTQLVTYGPYSVTRNPLYVFSTLATMGLGAQFGSLILALIWGAATVAIFVLVIRHEERALAELFPTEYALYKAKVPRFFPAFWKWHDVETMVVWPGLVTRTFWDALLFPLAIPALKGLERLREDWLGAPLLHLY